MDLMCRCFPRLLAAAWLYEPNRFDNANNLLKHAPRMLHGSSPPDLQPSHSTVLDEVVHVHQPQTKGYGHAFSGMSMAIVELS